MTDSVSRLGEIRARIGVTLKVFDEAYKQMPCNCPGGGVRTEQCRVAGVANVAGHELLADVGWLLEHIEQLQAEIERRNTPWQQSDLWGRMSAADPEIREALIQAWNERDRLSAQRQAVLDLCDKDEALHRRIWDEMDDYADIGHPKGPYPGRAICIIDEVRSALGADDDR